MKLKNFLYLSRVELLKIYNRGKINYLEEKFISDYYYIFLNMYELLSNANINNKDKRHFLHNVYSDILKCIEDIKWELRLKIWPITV